MLSAEDEKEPIQKDERRWAKADTNGDKMLSKEEYFDFLHPEESEKMRDIVIQVNGADLHIGQVVYRVCQSIFD